MFGSLPPTAGPSSPLPYLSTEATASELAAYHSLLAKWVELFGQLAKRVHEKYHATVFAVTAK